LPRAPPPRFGLGGIIEVSRGDIVNKLYIPRQCAVLEPPGFAEAEAPRR